MKYMACVLLGVAFCACEEKLETYSTETAWLKFNTQVASDTIITYSFVYSGADERDTIMIPVMSQGKVTAYPRQIALRQVITGEQDAVAGKHYVAFDNAEYRDSYVLPAGQAAFRVPVILLRDESLDTEDVCLVVSIAETEDFSVGFDGPARIRINISGRVMKPENWCESGIEADFNCTYSRVLHEFLIEVTGEKWDADYLRKLGYEGETYVELLPGFGYTQPEYNDMYDADYSVYYAKFLQEELAEKNKALGADGPLTDEYGNVITIGPSY